VRITKASESEPLRKRRKEWGGIETRESLRPWDEPGGCLSIGQVVSGVEVARAWSGLSCGMPGHLCGFSRVAAWLVRSAVAVDPRCLEVSVVETSPDLPSGGNE
jgi:hypothetical protein